jgi:hypothetical protein
MTQKRTDTQPYSHKYPAEAFASIIAAISQSGSETSSTAIIGSDRSDTPPSTSARAVKPSTDDIAEHNHSGAPGNCRETILAHDFCPICGMSTAFNDDSDDVIRVKVDHEAFDLQLAVHIGCLYEALPLLKTETDYAYALWTIRHSACRKADRQTPDISV